MRIVGACLVLLTMQAWSESLSEFQARFGAITGDVGLLTQGAAEWIEPHEGLPIEVGDHVRTGEDGQAEMVMSENVLWIMEAETDVSIDHTELHSGTLHLSSGTLMGRVDSARAAGTAQRWDFQMPAAIVAVRGTEFIIQTSKQSGTHAAVLEGMVEFQPAETAEGQAPPVKVEAGHEAIARRGRPVEISAQWSPSMKRWVARRSYLQRRHKRLQDTWSPFTPTVRTEMRRKFVAPIKARTKRSRPAPRRSARPRKQTS